ncbi:MAG TPA: DEAD/DEAH box helicase, partial [Arcobacter sp.]|nr:DEAD/DEAH box helicase [Arcobacter sp.]
QIEQFKAEYQEHNNIGLFDFDKLRELHPTLKLRNKKNVLFFDTGVVFNISVKWNSIKGWQSVKGTKANIGAFFKAEKKTSTLILTEGLKDGINANIAFLTADILSINGKSNSYNLKAHNIDLKKYKSIVFANDRDVKEEEFLKMFSIEYKEHFKKVRFINWDLIEHGKDITDIIQNIILPKCKTKRERLRSALPTLKKLLDKKNLIDKYAKLRAKEGLETLKTAIKADNKEMAMRAIKTLYMFDGNLKEAVKYYLTKQNETKSNSGLKIQLRADNRLSHYTKEIVEVLEAKRKVFLNAPTGTGKSYTSLTELPKQYKNIIIVSPLRMVTNEHGAEGTPYTNVKFDDKFHEVEADLNSNFIAVTTDAFVKLQHRYKESFKQRLEQADLIIFDEQHLYYDSLGFRDETVVACYDYLLYKYEGKTLFMSGTPILPKDKEVSLITAKVLEQNKENINFYYNPFDDTQQIIESIDKELESGSVLIYVNSRAKVSELENLLQNESIKTLSITSYDYKLDGEKVDDTILNEDLGNIVYISTTKATTGVNFKHLKTIYQYGTPYTPNTLIQLVARLRSGGKYFLIEPQFATLREQYNAKRAIGLSLAFQRLAISKISDGFSSDDFKKWLKSFVLLSHNNKSLQGFFKTYQKAFQLIESKGLGKFNESNDDFNFIGHNVKNIDELFEQDDKNEFRKYIEQILIDWTLKNDVELLNSYYNLSYKITNATYRVSENKHQLITDNDKEQKKEKRADIKDELKELYEQIDSKFESVKITSKLLKKYGFTDTELSKLNDIKIHMKKIKDISKNQDRITALKFHIIPKQAIFKIANELIIANGFLTIKELDSMLQKIFITNARSKAPYEKLLIETFSNSF